MWGVLRVIARLTCIVVVLLAPIVPKAYEYLWEKQDVCVCVRAFVITSDFNKEMTCSDEAVRGKIFHVAAKSTVGAGVVSKLLPVLSHLCTFLHWWVGKRA
jgi:hypothetical protein